LFDEMLKLLQTGHALATIEQLKELGLGKGIYPLLDLVVERAEGPFVRAALQDTDRRVGEGKAVAPSFLLACVLWSDVRDGWNRRMEEPGRLPPFPALQDAIDQVFSERIGDVSGGGRLASDMREIWMMQPRFEKRVGHSAFGLVDQPRFRAAFDFMRLRADVGEVEEVLADWWQEFSMANDTLRADMVEQVREEQGRSKVSRGPRPARKQTAPPAAVRDDEQGGAPAVRAASGDDAPAPPAASDAPRKRRRRRRPGGASPAAGTDNTPG
jgi:poly(A) polymerase